MKQIKISIKIKIKIFLIIFLILILNFPGNTAESETQLAEIELSVDKENYTIGETIYIKFKLTPNRPVGGSIIIYEIINETNSKQYWEAFSTVSCMSCGGRGGIKSIEEPFSETYNRELVDPGNYRVVANFGGDEKKVYFKVSGGNEVLENETAENLSENEPFDNESAENETFDNESAENETFDNESAENETFDNGPTNITLNAPENLTNNSGIEIIDENKIIETETESKPFFPYLLIISLLILIAVASLIVLFLINQ